MKIAVTGATGFVGRTVVDALLAEGHTVRALVRSRSSALPEAIEQVAVGDFEASPEWDSSLSGCGAVVHLAARAHRLADDAEDRLAAYRSANARVTAELADAAARVGVRRFVFLSSIKVNGERTAGAPFDVDSPPEPVDPYGVSKLEAELHLRRIAEQGTMSAVSVRSPLVYGRGAKGNIQRLLTAASRGIPLPFGSIRNRRTMVSVDNLASLLVYLTGRGSVPYATVLAGDAESPSTPEFYRALGAVAGRPARIVPFPVAALELAGRLLGRSADVRRLTESLEVRYGSTDPSFDWTPPYTFEESIEVMRAGRGSSA